MSMFIQNAKFRQLGPRGFLKVFAGKTPQAIMACSSILSEKARKRNADLVWALMDFGGAERDGA